MVSGTSKTSQSVFKYLTLKAAADTSHPPRSYCHLHLKAGFKPAFSACIQQIVRFPTSSDPPDAGSGILWPSDIVLVPEVLPTVKRRRNLLPSRPRHLLETRMREDIEHVVHDGIEHHVADH